MIERRKINTLQNGEQGFIPPHACWVRGGDMYINGDFPMSDEGLGSNSVRLLKNAEGRVFVDLSNCDNRGFDNRPIVIEPLSVIKVDEALDIPMPDPNGRRVCDMRGETAFVSAEDVWVYNGVRMWVNGYARLSDKLSGATPVKLVRDLHGNLLVDLLYCAGIDWATSPLPAERMFPMQVARRIG